ncbi:hypothetical protein ACK249_003659 [Pseudomonas aeruginosa]|nr:hypothetical protein [Pseudomonas aeruginosa]
MKTDYSPLSPERLATLPGVQALDVMFDVLVVLLIDDSSIAITRAPLAEELGLEKWSCMVGSNQFPSMSTDEVLDLIARTASAAASL